MAGHFVVAGGVFVLKEIKKKTCNERAERSDSDHPGAMLLKHSWRLLAVKGTVIFRMISRNHGPSIIEAFKRTARPITFQEM